MNRIKEMRAKRGMSQQAFAEALNTSRQQIYRLENSERRLTTDWMERIARVLGCRPADLLADSDVLKAEPLSTRPLPEIDVRAGAGGGGVAALAYRRDSNGDAIEIDAIRAQWALPENYVRSELRLNPRDGSVVEVMGDSMEPTLRSGDRVILNLADRTPSPPGVFALWDGLGLVVKRVEYLPNTDPMTFRISSDNQNHATYERTADEVNIVGRIVGLVRRL